MVPNLQNRCRQCLTASDIKPLAHLKLRRRRRGAPPSRYLLTVVGCVAVRVFSLFSGAYRRQSFIVSPYKSFAFNLQLAPPIMIPERMNVEYLEFVWRKDRNHQLSFRHPVPTREPGNEVCFGSVHTLKIAQN